MHTLHTASWMKEFPGVVGKGLGRLVGIKASIEIREGAQPKFCKHRPIPFAQGPRWKRLFINKWWRVNSNPLSKVIGQPQ